MRPDTVPLNSGTLAALGAAISLALSVIAIKRLTSTERPLQILFYMSALHTMFAFVMLKGAVAFPSAPGGALAALLALTGLVVHYCMSRAYTLGDALLVTPVDFVRLPLIALVGLWPPLSATRIGYGLGLLLAFELSLGYNGIIYPWLHDYVLPYRGLRVPARMAMVVWVIVLSVV